MFFELKNLRPSISQNKISRIMVNLFHKINRNFAKFKNINLAKFVLRKFRKHSNPHSSQNSGALYEAQNRADEGQGTL
jgi:hypothetical protein